MFLERLDLLLSQIDTDESGKSVTVNYAETVIFDESASNAAKPIQVVGKKRSKAAVEEKEDMDVDN